MEIANDYEKERLLKLQKDFSEGKITEEEIEYADYIKLDKLYDEQIELLNHMKEMYKKKIQMYKEDTRKKLDLLKKLKSE